MNKFIDKYLEFFKFWLFLWMLVFLTELLLFHKSWIDIIANLIASGGTSLIAAGFIV